MKVHILLAVVLVVVLYFLDSVYTKAVKQDSNTHTEDGEYFEGDMELSTAQLNDIKNGIITTGNNVRSKRKAIRKTNYRWPQGIIPYEIDASIDANTKKDLLSAIRDWQKKTCVRFIPYSTVTAVNVGHNDHVRFFKGSGCWSTVGHLGGMQEMSIGKNCHRGHILHELGHLIGLYHEQSRPDRDTFVSINIDNIKAEKTGNFKKYTHSEVNDYGIPYDIASIMHYSANTFSNGKGRTIEPKQTGLLGAMGQRSSVSFVDAKVVNRMYTCSDSCPTKKVICANKGYIGPQCTCSCPDGLKGETCEEVDSTRGCGGVLTSQSGSIQSSNYPNVYNNSQKCFWIIKGPKDSNIQLTINNMKIENEENCKYDWLEVHTNGPHLAGPRYCGNKKDSQIKYRKNTLLISFKSDQDAVRQGFHISYRILQTITMQINGGWSEFSSWTVCCGGSLQVRLRKCNKPAPTNGGQECQGKATEYRISQN